jgi:hypothetical protein
MPACVALSRWNVITSHIVTHGLERSVVVWDAYACMRPVWSAKRPGGAGRGWRYAHTIPPPPPSKRPIGRGSRPPKDSGHFRVKIYSKPEVPVMRQLAAKKPSVFHTELLLLWSMQVLQIGMPRVPRAWNAPLIAPFRLFGATTGGEKTDHQCPRRWFSSSGSPSFGLLWPIKEAATCGKVSQLSLHSVEKTNDMS